MMVFWVVAPCGLIRSEYSFFLPPSLVIHNGRLALQPTHPLNTKRFYSSDVLFRQIGVVHPCKAMSILPELSSQRTALFIRRDYSTPTKRVRHYSKSRVAPNWAGHCILKFAIVFHYAA